MPVVLKEPLLWRAQRTHLAYYLGHRRAQERRDVRRVLEISERYLWLRAAPVHLVLGDYTIHKAHVVTRYLAALNGRTVLHFLPPYPPLPLDDNVIEGLWKQMQARGTRNHRHKYFDSLFEAVRDFPPVCSHLNDS